MIKQVVLFPVTVKMYININQNLTYIEILTIHQWNLWSCPIVILQIKQPTFKQNNISWSLITFQFSLCSNFFFFMRSIFSSSVTSTFLLIPISIIDCPVWNSLRHSSLFPKALLSFRFPSAIASSATHSILKSNPSSSINCHTKNTDIVTFWKPITTNNKKHY